MTVTATLNTRLVVTCMVVKHVQLSRLLAKLVLDVLDKLVAMRGHQNLFSSEAGVTKKSGS